MLQTLFVTVHVIVVSVLELRLCCVKAMAAE